MTKELLIQQLESIAESLAGMAITYGPPDLAMGITIAEGVARLLRSELATRDVDLHDAMASVDAATQAALLAKFGGKP